MYKNESENLAYKIFLCRKKISNPQNNTSILFLNIHKFIFFVVTQFPIVTTIILHG